MAVRRFRIGFSFVLVVGLLALGGPSRLVPPAAAADDEVIDRQLEKDLAAALKAKADALWKEKNEAGQNYQRGSYGKKFRKVDDGTYQAVFLKDIAGPDRMRTERYLVTLKGSGTKWEVTDEVLEGVYEKLIRNVPGDETFHRFDSFSFEHEGMTVSTGSGSLIQDYELGQPARFLLTGDGLRYDYTPPADLPGQQTAVWAHLKALHPDSFSFGAEGLILSCDAETCKRILEEAFHGVREASRDELDKVLVNYYDDQLKDQTAARKDQPFAGFHLPDEPDRRRYSAGIKKQGKDQWIWMTYDSMAPWEVNLFVSDYGRILGYPSAATRKAGVDPYQLELRDDPDARRYDLVAVDGNVEVALDEAELLRADLTFTVLMKEDAQEIPFQLSSFEDTDDKGKNAAITVNALSDVNGEPLVFVRRGPTGGLVILSEPVTAGTEVVVHMGYETTGSIYKLTSSYSYVDRGAWLPFARFEDAISRFDVAVTAPAKYETLCVGNKVSEKRDGDRKTAVCSAREVHFPTIIFGDYMNDKPTTVAKKSDGTEIPVEIHVDRVSVGDWGIRGKSLRPLAEQAVNAINIYEKLYGADYPHDKLDLVNDTACLAGQSPASIVYVGSCVFRGEAVLADAFQQSGYVAQFVDSLIAHEVGHQWWGGLVCNRSARDYWFVESLAEYSAALFLEIVESEGYQKPEKGRKAYQEMVDGWRKEILEADLWNSVQNSLVAYVGPNRGGATRALNYAKGPYAFHILRSTFGDEKFFPFLLNLMQELKGQSIVTRDIQRVAEQSFGGTMEWFFDQWIRGVGIPQYSFNYSWRQAEDGGFIVEGNVRQRVVAGLERFPLDGVYYRGIVPVYVLGKDKNEYRKGLLVEGPETKFALKVPSEPVEVALNKHGEILSLPVLDNRGW